MSLAITIRGRVAAVMAAAFAVGSGFSPSTAVAQAIVNQPYSFIDLSVGNHRAGSSQNIWDVTGGDAAGTVVSVDVAHYSNSTLYYLGYITDKSNTYDVTTGTFIPATGNAGHGYLSYDPDVAQVYFTFPQAMKIGMMRFYPSGWYGFGSGQSFVTDYAVSYQDQGVWQPLISRQTVTPSQIPAGVSDARTIFRDHTFSTVTAQNWRITLTNGEGGFTSNATFGEIQFFSYVDPGNRWAPGLNGGGSGTWSSTGTNWSIANGQRGTRLQAGSGTLLFGDNAGTVTLGSAVTAAAGLQFTVDGYAITGTHTLTLGGASLAVNAITADPGVNATIDAIVSGTTGLTKAGTGILTLAGTNTYTGGTVVSGGRLVGNAASLRGAITNNAAVTFDQATSGTITSAISGSGSFLKTASGTLTLTASNSYTGGIEVAAGLLRGHTLSLVGDIANDAAVAFDQADAGTYARTMSGSGSLTKAGASTLTMTGSNAFAGPISIDAGTLSIGGSGVLGSGSHAGGITIAAGGRLMMGSAADQVLAGSLAGGGSLVKSGNGRLTLSGSNMLTGPTTVSAGTLALGQHAWLANSSTITVGGSASSGTVLDLTAKSGLFSFGAGQKLGGGGTVRVASSGTLGVLGTFAPGNSPGLFTYDGGTTLLSGTTVMEIFGTSRSTLPSHGSGFYDAVDVINGGTLNFAGGMLRLTFSSTFALNTTFDLFQALDSSQLVGDFAGISVFGSHYTGLAWGKSGGVWVTTHTPEGMGLMFDPATGQLAVVPEPAGLILTGLGVAAVAAIARHAARRRRARSPALDPRASPAERGAEKPG